MGAVKNFVCSKGFHQVFRIEKVAKSGSIEIDIPGFPDGIPACHELCGKHADQDDGDISVVFLDKTADFLCRKLSWRHEVVQPFVFHPDNNKQGQSGAFQGPVQPVSRFLL